MRERAVQTLSGADGAELEKLRETWCLGGESFRQRMLDLLDQTGDKLRARREVDSAVRRTHDHVEASRILRLGLEHFGLCATDLLSLRKGDHRKLAIARVIRERTAVSNAWIAEALSLGHLSRINHSSPAHEPKVAAAAEALRKITIF